ncbi:ephrin type-B receptor [Rhynchospora pubera]|uniref:Ephrin type-B receptor n=1 Tax=Rhynchospora pubera TaxID=906938 RepID=A0AAV8CTH0_9POAL|nr:ephrin type-B receptor [Rhynchospora pubera]
MPLMLNHGNWSRWILLPTIVCLIEPLQVKGSTPCNSFSHNSFSCNDLKGVGSFNTTCFINSDAVLSNDLCIYGTGNLHLSPNKNLTCPIKGCQISVNLSGDIDVGSQASIIAGSIKLSATNIFLKHKSIVNTTSLGGGPPSQTSGTPPCCEKAGGGHGGRGASCVKMNRTNWGGDVYAWSTLSDPWSYGSKGGTASSEKEYGGDGGGRVALWANKSLVVEGFVLAEGGEGGKVGGGGSGGSIVIHAFKLTGNGTISAAGGPGWGGGGGGRISTECYSIQQDVTISVHGGRSHGCPQNAGGAGTIYDKSLQTLKVSNENFTTRTETPLLGFPVSILWSNVLVEGAAQVLVPLLWTRVQVTGQIKLIDGGSICFGLSENPISEFELVAEELLMSDSVIKVYGAFRMYVKMLLMWDSKIRIEGGHNEDVRVSMLEVRNLVVLKQNSVVSSNADLVIYGQGLLNLSGSGDGIKARRLFLSLFYNILVGPGSFLQAPLDGSENSSDTQLSCESQACPNELIMPPDDCHANSSLSFTLQICRVEDIIVSGVVKGSVIHIHRARTVAINTEGTISASELGCKEGIGKGKFLTNGAGGGAGHGGKGGSGFYNGLSVDGGRTYGDPDLPCELGSGTGSSSGSEKVSGGGMIVVGSMKWPLSKLEMHGSLSADGQSPLYDSVKSNGSLTGGPGGGSGGTILLFLQSLVLKENSSLSAAGGSGGPHGGGGGGGGRVHFHWSNIATGDEYVKIASVNGTILSSGGKGNAGGRSGEDGSITGKKCPKGLYGTFCRECPIGTYKDVVGSNSSLCVPCSLDSLPYRADFIYVRGGATQPSCPYRCLSDKYKMPNCYTPIEEIIYTFGGPWAFAILLTFLLVLVAFLITALRIKMGEGDYSYTAKSAVGSDGHASFPYLLSLAEVPGTSKAEETQSHVHRMYFMGPNTFREPWHLPYSPPDAIIGIVYEDAFNRFIDEINLVAAYEWWEGSVHSILSVVAYPCAWSWKQWCRRNKIHRLQEYVKSEYDHSCLRSCRSRALYKGMKVGSTPDLMVAYIDFFLGGDEKRLDVVSSIQKRFPMCIIFGGDGSYMSPYNLHSDALLSNLVGQYVSTAIWNRFVSGLNAQLRTVNRRKIRTALAPVLSWISTHGNPQLERSGVRVELGWFQATASGYYQLGIVVSINEVFFTSLHSPEMPESSDRTSRNMGAPVKVNVSRQVWLNQSQPQSMSNRFSRKRLTGGVNGGIINEGTLGSLDYRRDYLFPLSLLLQNTRPIGFQEAVQLLMCTMLLGDFVITLLTLVHFYWISVGAFLVILLMPPLSALSPFLAGLNAIFSRGPKRSSLSRIYALWNATSIVNIFVAFICGLVFYCLFSSQLATLVNNSSLKRDDNEWWVLPLILLLVKALQEGLVNWHIANVEIQDLSLFTPDPDKFWAM